MLSSFANGDHQKALKIHLSLIPLLKALFITSNPVPVKTALNLLGIDVGGVRLPLFEATHVESEMILQTLQNMKMISENPVR
jgi:4-hydroxy-tetrahydrodipicolinate synthase